MQETIKIGQSELEVSRINFGGNVLGWTLDEKQSFEILDAFVNEGFNFIDTADVYSAWVAGNQGGESETIIGKWLKSRGHGDKIVVATKVGWDFGDGRKGLKPAYIKKAAEDSLRRLQRDTIDLYYTHIDDGDIPVEEYLGAYADLINEGKIRYIAASNVPADRLEKSLSLGASGSYPLYQALQPHYNLVERAKYENEYASIVDQFGITVFPYWSLASGFLTGKYRSEEDLGKSVRGEGVRKYLNPQGLEILKVLDQLAIKHGSQPATVALSWLLAQPHIGAPIVSATTASQLQTLVAAPGLKLDADDLEQLQKASQ
ncbi:aldo/keto reductase [Sphingobacterium sp. LRF_L2]|uniref:aldo/keto reductase n=1 Tax=Sphingobacterium sp. LRF_L2 TaxID=3369421 RepID=UPI003F64359B